MMRFYIFAQKYVIVTKNKDRYDNIEEIGEGGFSRVYKAHDTYIKQTVIIKVIDKNMIRDDPKVLKALKNEIKSLRNLQSRNIIELLGVVETQ